MELNLGIIYEDGKIVSHRSLLKVVLNPFLRAVGLQVGTPYNPETERLGWPALMRTPRCPLRFSWNYPLGKNQIAEKKRVWI